MCTVTQIGWAMMIVVDTTVLITYLWAIVLVACEMLGPYLAERRMGGTPWHAHHIAERYSLLTIIALGEGVVGTVASLSAVVSAQGWSVAAVLVAVAGTGLTFGMWWVYFIVPQSQLLHARRELSFKWGYLHLVVFGAIVGTGAGLHAAAYYVEHHSKLSAVGTVLSVAIPVAIYVAAVYLIYLWLTRARDAFHLLLLVLTVAGVGRRGAPRRSGHVDGQRPADRHAGACRHRRRLRTARLPARRRGHRSAFSRRRAG